MTLFIALASSLAYVAGFVVVARLAYARLRPYREPLNCDKCILCRPLSYGEPLDGGGRGGHCYGGRCWAQPGGVNTEPSAVCWSAEAGLLWPVLLPGMLLYLAITSRARETPEEVAAQTARLERELGIGDKP